MIGNTKLLFDRYVKYKDVWIQCFSLEVNEKHKYYMAMLDMFNPVYFKHLYQAKMLIDHYEKQGLLIQEEE
jgi:hypothetical protein|tara:strand:- start:94 stop:306 length:213 start_codon:yes stop_codon:yes gene_type:complete